jgi:hypothetical protein
MATKKDPGHSYAATDHITFQFFELDPYVAPYPYEFYVSLPPQYSVHGQEKWPLVLFLHGLGECQRVQNGSYVSLRHGIPKIILCYNKLKDGMDPPNICIPNPPETGIQNSDGMIQDGDDASFSPVSPEICQLVAENFVTVTPSLKIGKPKTSLVFMPTYISR